MGTIAVINCTANGGTAWTDATSRDMSGSYWHGTGFSGLVATDVVFDAPRRRVALMAMDDGKWIESLDGLKSWRWGGKGLNHYDGGEDAIFWANGQTIYASFGQNDNYDGVAKSIDGGSNWVYLTTPATQGAPLGIYALPSKSSNVWFTVNGLLYASEDGGESW